MLFRRKREEAPRPERDPESLFDTVRGTLYLGRGVRVYPGMTIGEVMVQGLTFVRELPMGNGWLYSTTAPRVVNGRRFFFSLQTYCGQLTSVGLGFPLRSEMDQYRDALLILEGYRAFLEQELGPAPASAIDDGLTEYSFPWGSISAQFDRKAGYSSMTVRWN